MRLSYTPYSLLLELLFFLKEEALTRRVAEGGRGGAGRGGEVSTQNPLTSSESVARAHLITLSPACVPALSFYAPPPLELFEFLVRIIEGLWKEN